MWKEQRNNSKKRISFRWYKMELVFRTILLVVLQQCGVCSSSSCSSRSFNVNDGVKNRALVSRVFKTSTINENHAECFISCSADCRCLSFNVCGKQCQLNADTREMTGTSLKIKQDCSYYKLRQTQKTSFPRCCLMSNPCLNGGTCSSGTKNNNRFSCVCRSGFFGNRCEVKNPRSCADFMTESVKPLSGEYAILDDSGNPFQVHCDFDSESGFAWTLILSYSLDSGASSIDNTGLLDDNPVNEDTTNWVNYRLSLSRMTSLRERSTHWRATCGFDVAGVDYQEYIRVNLSVVDFSTYYYLTNNIPTACQTIEYMNIFGSECHNCNFGLYYRSGATPFLFPLFSKRISGCTFDLSAKQHFCGTVQASLFRHSDKGCYYPQSKCQMTGSSTTQNWFGKGPI